MKNGFRSAYALRLVAIVPMGALLSGCAPEAPPTAPAIPSTQVAAIKTPMPHYPVELGCAGIGGVVTLSLAVATDGKPADVKLVASSGQPALDQSALEGVKSWQFEPATRGGKPVVQSIQVPVNFKPPQVRPNDCFSLDEQR